MKTTGTGFFLIRVCGLVFACLCVGCFKAPGLMFDYSYNYSYDGRRSELIEDQTVVRDRFGNPIFSYGPQTVRRMREIKICLSTNRVTVSEVADLLNLEQARMGIPRLDSVIFVATIDDAWYDPDRVKELEPFGPERVPGPPLVDIEAKDTPLLDVVCQVCRQIPRQLRARIGLGDITVWLDLKFPISD